MTNTNLSKQGEDGNWTYAELVNVSQMSVAKRLQLARIDGAIEALETLGQQKWADLAYDIPGYLKDNLAALKAERTRLMGKQS